MPFNRAYLTPTRQMKYGTARVGTIVPPDKLVFLPRPSSSPLLSPAPPRFVPCFRPWVSRLLSIGENMEEQGLQCFTNGDGDVRECGRQGVLRFLSDVCTLVEHISATMDVTTVS